MIKHDTFIDNWRGNGWFISFLFPTWHVLFAVRKQWHLDYVEPPAKRGYKRWYFGPFEVEIYTRPRTTNLRSAK